MDKERALKLAQKLAAINGKNATEAEAILAAEHLARIAQEHGFTRLDWSKEEVRSHVKSDKAQMNCDRRAKLPTYGRLLILTVANALGVKAILLGDTGMVDFIGDETNIVLVKFFLEELMAVIPKLRWKAKCDMRVAGQNRAWKESWERGFIHTIGERLAKINSNMSDQQAIATRALVLVTNAMIDHETANKYPNLKTSSICFKHHTDHAAYHRGVMDGSKARLQANVG